MADNAVTANAGSGGATFASDQIGGIEYPRAKIVWGADGTATDTSAAAPLPVVQTGALPAGDNNVGNVDVLSLPALVAGTANIGDVDVLSLPALPSGTNNIGGVTAHGNVAHDSPESGNPVAVGAVARTALPTAVAAGDRTTFYTDTTGKLIVLPYSIPESLTLGVAGPITNTTVTSVGSAAGAGLRNYITSLTVTNSHATVGTTVLIDDSVVGSRHIGYAAPAGGGYAITFPSPLRCGANVPVRATCGTTGSSIYVSWAGYIAP